MDLSIEPEGIAMAVFRVIYSRRKPTSLEKKKPLLKWFPKYLVPIELPDSIINDGGQFEKLELALAEFGFELKHWTKKAVFFSRGKKWGDFSIRLIPLIVSLPTPLSRDSVIQVEVADVCLFDTGDLWKLGVQLKQGIEKEIE